MPRFSSFAEFWPYYLAQHGNPATRGWHYAGLALTSALLLAGWLAQTWALALAAPLAGYGLSWLGHGIAEGNRPATFRHPLWSLKGDFRMAALALTGRLGAELAKYGLG